MFTKRFLLEVRQKALRRGIWFKSLDNLERGILLLSSKVLDSVKNGLLSLQITKIVTKITNACKSVFQKRCEQYGLERVRVIQIQAKILGYKLADSLCKNLEFINYLMFIDYYQPKGLRIYGEPN
jgi:hypothetical protein